MPLRIAVDLDGVLADMHGELARQAEALFGEAATGRRIARASPSAPNPRQPQPDLPSLERLQLTSRDQRRLWRHVETIENFWETLKEAEPGMVRQLAAIATDRRWEVIFLTTRPTSAGATCQIQTQRWLAAQGFELPSVYVVRGSRGRIAAALDLDFVIDDRPENCLDVVVDSQARAILVWPDDEKQLPLESRRMGIGVVKSFEECLDILAEIDTPSERGGFVDRVKRLLGLKEPAGV
ncbi:MAG: hypothetical protein WBD07_07835 [Vicinamibacterales bacterium]